MIPGTIVLVIRTCAGCYGAENRVCIVTDEPNDHGLSAKDPGYNVALLCRGQIWRINPDAEVKILYNPYFH